MPLSIKVTLILKAINFTLIYFFLLFVLSSCSHYSFKQEGSLDILSGSSHGKTQNKYTVIVETENLLWGFVPGEYGIELTQKLLLDRYRVVGKMSLKSYQTFSQKLLMILSLGIYIPESLEFEFWSEYVQSE